MRPTTLYLFLFLTLCAGHASAQVVGGTTTPDFALIDHFAHLNDSIRYDPGSVIERAWSSHYEEIFVVDIRETRNRYFLGIDNRHRLQDIAIRGTTNLRNAAFDLLFLKAYSPTLGISVHRGFEMMAAVLDRKMQPYLRKDYPLRLSGQSLGAAEALILAMMLSKQGYHIDRIVTFGQPKVTDAAGAAAYADLPLMRVVDMNDIVPLLPPANLVYRQNPYVHFGKEIVLLDGKHYCVADKSYADRKVPDALIDRLFSREELQALLREHSISSYVTLIEPKLKGAVKVPCSESNRYIPPTDQIPRS